MKRLFSRGATLLVLGVLILSLAACSGPGVVGNTSGAAEGAEGSDSQDVSDDETSDHNTQNETELNTEPDEITDGSEKKLMRVGISQFIEHDALDASREGFIDGLALAGYIEGETLEITFSNAQGDAANSQTIAQQLAAGEYDILVGIATTAAQPMVNLIKDTPVLVTSIADPVYGGLVESLEEPGANVTGTKDSNPAADQVDLLLEMFPEIETVAVMHSSSEPNGVIQGEIAVAALEERGINVLHQTVANSNDLQSVVEGTIGLVDAWYISTDNLFASSMGIISQVGAEANMPIMVGERNMMEGGALATISLDYYDSGLQIAELAVEIFEEGTDPGTIPVRLPRYFNTYVNEEYAARIGYEIPQAILDRATPRG